MTKTQRDVLCGAALAGFLLTPVPVLADVAGEITTATTHATLAGEATALTGVQMHLHHVLNCLVGAGGKGYDAKQIDPCKGAGSGAIPDMSDAAKKKALEGAANTTRAGIAAADMATATKAATEAASELKALK